MTTKTLEQLVAKVIDSSRLTHVYTSQSMRERFVANIRWYLAENGVAQYELAKDIGVHSVKLSYELNGHRELSLRRQLDICKSLGINPYDAYAAPRHFKAKYRK